MADISNETILATGEMWCVVKQTRPRFEKIILTSAARRIFEGVSAGQVFFRPTKKVGQELEIRSAPFYLKAKDHAKPADKFLEEFLEGLALGKNIKFSKTYKENWYFFYEICQNDTASFRQVWKRMSYEARDYLRLQITSFDEKPPTEWNYEYHGPMPTNLVKDILDPSVTKPRYPNVNPDRIDFTDETVHTDIYLLTLKTEPLVTYDTALYRAFATMAAERNGVVVSSKNTDKENYYCFVPRSEEYEITTLEQIKQAATKLQAAYDDYIKITEDFPRRVGKTRDEARKRILEAILADKKPKDIDILLSLIQLQ